MASLLKDLCSVAESLSPMRRFPSLFVTSLPLFLNSPSLGPRFYKFVVKRLLGPFIKYDLDLDQAKTMLPASKTSSLDHTHTVRVLLQLDIKLGEGMVQLHDLELNAEVS